MNPNTYSLVVAAEVLAHEAVHVLQRFYDVPTGMSIPGYDSYEAEREAYIVSLAVNYQLTGVDRSSDLKKLFKDYASAVLWLGDIGYTTPPAWVDDCASNNCAWESNLRTLGISGAEIYKIRKAAKFNFSINTLPVKVKSE
jgi:hypothetical protein